MSRLNHSQTLLPYVSEKITVFHSIGIIFVMLNHCGFEQMLPFTRVFTEIFANSSRWAVCMYFAISGYLFFQGIDSSHILSTLYSKYKRRIRTLLVPLILWSLFGTVIYTLLYDAGLRDEWTLMAHGISQGSIVRLFLHPGMLQMWFVRDLVICMIWSLPLFYIFRYVGVFSFFLYLGMLYIGISSIPFIGIPIKSLFFFSIGGCASVRQWNIDTRRFPKQITILLAILSFGSFVYLAFSPHEMPLLIIPLTSACFVAVWLIYDHCYSLLKRVSTHLHLNKTGFFLFASFEPLYYLSKYLVAYLLGDLYDNYSVIQIIVLTLMYIIMFFLLNSLAFFFHTKTPAIYNILTGARN